PTWTTISASLIGQARRLPELHRRLRRRCGGTHDRRARETRQHRCARISQVTHQGRAVDDDARRGCEACAMGQEPPGWLDDTRFAAIAEAGVTPEGKITVTRVTVVCDPGIVVDPGSVKSQIEGGVIFGLSNLLHGGIDIVGGGTA